MTDSIISQLGQNLKRIRKEKGLKLVDVAQKAHISKGLLSRIENSRTIPSLPVLVSVVQALDEEMSSFFRLVYQMRDKPYLLLRKEDYQSIEKEEATGFHYRHILTRTFSSITVETVLLSLEAGAKRELITTDAYEYKYILTGSAEYQLGDETLRLREGDSLFFNGRLPHAPTNPSESTCIMLVVYFFFNEEPRLVAD